MPTQDPLNEQEIAEVQRLFGAPFFIPPAFKSWMADQLALNIPDLPLGSLFGGRGITRSLDATTAASAASANGTTGILYSKVIQGGTLGANGHVRLMLEGHYTQASGSQTYDLDFLFGGTTMFSLPESSGGNRDLVIEFEVYNANDPRVQYGAGLRLRLTSGSGTLNTLIGANNGAAAVDTTVDQTLAVHIRYAGINAGDHWDRTYANLEIVNPAPLGATL